MRNFSRILLITLLQIGGLYAESALITYNAHIRPILSDKCIACHGPDGKKREADLRLDTYEGATAPLKESKGKFAIVAGKPEKSELFDRIDSKNEHKVMPPHHFHKKITAQERELLWKWIAQGAEYEKHWAYTPIVKKTSLTQTENPIDGFIADRLVKESLEPSKRAELPILLRRLSLDLIGLPPAPEEVDRFEKAASSDFDTAYKEAVDRLLASPQYGERMSVPWLDIVRFSDTVGFHGDQNMRIFPYRDYVIDAFNDNKPFDEFVIEQLAGDLLKNPTTEQLVASGFNRLSLMSREGGIQPKEYLTKYTGDRVRAVGQAFLGQTTGCAECHDHKFDPISAKDYYSLGAFFDDIQQWGIYSGYPYSIYKGLEGFHNGSPFPPELVHESKSQLRILSNLQSDMISLLGEKHVSPDALEAWQKQMELALADTEDGWAQAKLISVETTQNTPYEKLADGSVEFTGPALTDDLITLSYDLPHTQLGSIQIEALTGDEPGGTVGRNASGGFHFIGAELPPEKGQKPSKNPKREQAIRFFLKSIDGSEKALDLAWSQANLLSSENYRRDYKGGDFRDLRVSHTWASAPGRWEQPLTLNRETHTAVFSLESGMKARAGDQLIVKLSTADVTRLRLAITPFLVPVPGHAAAPADILEALVSENSDHLNAAYHLSEGSLSAFPDPVKKLNTRIRYSQAGWARTLISVSRPREDYLKTRILPRGDWTDDSGPIVEPAVFDFLPSDSVPKNRRLTRLDLANWIVAEENPLTARHFVNRTWKQFFGSGLSNILGDLGAQGEWPSHPELLDWLAADFRESGWNVKKLIRLIVTSEAYQRAAAHRDDLRDIDPGYRLYAQQAPRRLDAEFIRDNALAISGLINMRNTGGPSVKPYQPDGHYRALNFPIRGYSTTLNEDQYRRGVYMHWQRTFLHPMLANFDAPNRVECSADRLQANSPQQALTLLNDPTFVEAARAFAAQLMVNSDIKSDEQLIHHAFRSAISRQPSDAEVQSLTAFLARQREAIAMGQDDVEKLLDIGLHRAPEDLNKNELAAITQLCRVILNLHETITRY